MNYPLLSDYIEAIKAAEDNFEQQKSLRPVLGADGEPIFSSGNFAVVFKMKDEQTGKLHAVKCFLREQEGRAEAYRQIAEELEYVSSTFLTPIKYLDKELFVDTNASDDTEFPVLLMDWVEGETLDKYIRKHLNDQYELSLLAYQFSRLAMWLMPQPFAHGDLKPDNILVKSDGTLVLVDYDGMYVPAMKGQRARELGSPDFRHPSRTESVFDDHIDDFSLASILLSLKAISLQPSLLEEYGASDRLLLSEEDYRNISQSRFFKEVFPSDIMELNKLMNLFMLALSEHNLSSVSSSLFKIKNPVMKFYSTEVTEEDYTNVWIDELGVVYSADRRRLLKVPNNLLLSKYSIREGTLAIGDNAFEGNTQICSVYIPDSVVLIGNDAFSGCNSLYSITIPESVTKIGKSAFEDCSSLQTITLPNELTSIEEETFYYCKSLQTINFPDSLNNINNFAFFGCESIQIIILPNKVTSLGFGVFHECTSLKSIVIPDSVITIDSLGDITPSTIFVSPSSFSRFELMLKYSNYQQCLKPYTKETDVYGATYSEDGKTLLNGPDNYWVKDYPIRQGTLVIGEKAFERSDLHSITIPNTVTTIDNHAFSGCYLLQEIIIPDSVTTIGDFAFSVCNNLKSVKLPDTVTHIGEGAFYICESLLDINIPISVLSIGSHAFGYCKSLKSITIPPSVQEIQGNPFSGYNGDIISKSPYFIVCNDNLYDNEMITLISYNSKDKEFSLPDSVKSIGDSAFYDCSEIQTVNIPSSVCHIGESAFYRCHNLQSVTIPNTVKSIGKDAFQGCQSLLSVNIPSSLTVISEGLFYYCKSLCKIEIPESILSIENCAFCDCSSLQEIIIPNSVISIGKCAFSGCSSLQYCRIPNSISSINERTFYSCTSLQRIILPDSINSIGDYAFSGCKELLSVSYSNSIKYIGRFAFDDCENLQTVEIHSSDSYNEKSSVKISLLCPDSNSTPSTCINDRSFRNCVSLQSISIPNSITSIGKYAFSGCSLLQTIKIPESVVSISEHAFQNCKNLENIILPNKLNSIPNFIFEYCDSLKTIIIPDSVVNIGPCALFFIDSIFVSQTSYERIKGILPNYLHGKLKIIINNDD